MLDEGNRPAFAFVLRARKDKDIPEAAARVLSSIPLLDWYFTVLNSLLLEAAENGTGLPPADYLLRLAVK